MKIFPQEFNTDRPLLDNVQPVGNIMCACYGVCDVAEDFTGKEYDIQDLFDRVPSTNLGTDPLKVISEAIKNGLMPVGGTVREFPFTHGDIKAHIGEYDAFDNLREKMLISKIPVLMWGPVYFNWLSGIMPIGDVVTSYHAVDIEGWTTIDGEPYLQMEFWTGRKYLLSREVFNWWAKQYGFDSRILTDDATDELFKKDFLTTIIRQLQTIVSLLLRKKQSVGRIPTLYDVAYSLMGRHLTLDLNIPKEVGCGQAMSYVLKKYGALIPNKGISGTASLYDWLKKNATEISIPRVGCIVIYVTGTGNGKIPGHVFVNGYRSMMSNSSKTGLWGCDWTIGEAKEYYEEYGGLKAHYFVI